MSYRFVDSFRAGVRSLFSVHLAMVYVIQVCGQLSSRTRMELQFHPGLARKLSTNLYDIFLRCVIPVVCVTNKEEESVVNQHN